MVDRCLLEQAFRLDGGIIDQTGNRAKFGDAGPHHGGGPLGINDVAHLGYRLAARRADVGGNGFCGLAIHIVDDDSGAHRRRSGGIGRAHAATGTGDDDRMSYQIHVNFPQPRGVGYFRASVGAVKPVRFRCFCSLSYEGEVTATNAT